MPTTSGAKLTSGKIAVSEIHSVANPKHSNEKLHQLWLRGGFPKSFLAGDEAESIVWRQDYLRSIFGPQSIANNSVDRPTLLEPLWEHLSIKQGEPCDIHQQLGCRTGELKSLLRFLVESQLLRELRPWFRNEGKRLDKPPRYFIRDSGLLNVKWGFQTYEALMKHDIKGKSWEGFILETLVNVTSSDVQAYFFRNHAKDEVDIVLEFNPNRRWAIEVKLSSDPTVSKGFYRASEELEAEHRFVVHGGMESLKMGAKLDLDGLCLPDAITLVRSS